MLGVHADVLGVRRLRSPHPRHESMEMLRLDGKVAIVTGAAKGMGRTHCEVLAEAGAKVVVADVDTHNGEQVAEAIGANAVFHALDVTDVASWSTMVEDTVRDLGSVDVLVNNAG
jgi:3alpha(or 20beta)-hydroxysteroid dehydrogenase